MRREARIGALAFLLSFSVSFAVSSWSLNGAVLKRIMDQHQTDIVGTIVSQLYESCATMEQDEILTGMCTFGDCPVLIPTEIATEIATDCNYVAKTESKTEQIAKNVQIEADYTPKNVQATETDAEVVAENETTETAYVDDNFNGYIGRMYVTGYTAEEGFYEGSPTASGVGAGPGTCAMNNSQRRSLGIKYGDRIYVEGLGTYTVTNCGCDWGVVDIWLYTNAEAYSITGYYNVYYA